jgi:hypothetical protein
MTTGMKGFPYGFLRYNYTVEKASAPFPQKSKNSGVRAINPVHDVCPAFTAYSGKAAICGRNLTAGLSFWRMRYINHFKTGCQCYFRIKF